MRGRLAVICRRRIGNIIDSGKPAARRPRMMSTDGDAPRSISTRGRVLEEDHASDSSLPRIIPTEGVPIHLYAQEIEPQALEQVKRLAESPLPTGYVAVMPDAHLGVSFNICSYLLSFRRTSSSSLVYSFHSSLYVLLIAERCYDWNGLCQFQVCLSHGSRGRYRLRHGCHSNQQFVSTRPDGCAQECHSTKTQRTNPYRL